MVCFSFLSPKASWSAEYPSVSGFFTCVTTQGPASIMVQAVCLPEGSKMLVIPIFFPIIPFIFLTVFPRKVVQDSTHGTWVFNPGSSPDLFLCFDKCN